MNVRETIPLANGCAIEIGGSTWNPTESSVRYRCPNSRGGFDPHSSSELPVSMIEPILTSCINRDMLDAAAAARLIDLLAQSVQRQLPAALVPPPRRIV